MANILVVTTVATAQTLGAGGTLLKLKEQGHKIYWCIVTKMSSEKGFTKERMVKREKEIKEVSKLFGFSKVFQLDFITTELDQVSKSELVDAFTKVIKEVKPETVFLPFFGDVHSDHKVVFEAGFSCTKSFRYPFIKEVYMMETISETDQAPAMPSQYFVPNVFFDVTFYIRKKLKIMTVYNSEIAPAPFPRSLETIEAHSNYPCSITE